MQYLNYQPTFIYKLHRERFGGDQEGYTHTAKQTIEETANRIIQCKENKGDIKKLFFEIIKDLSQKRSEIALKHGTEKAHHFGVRRDKYLPGQTSYLALNTVYQTYGDQLISLFSEYVKTMEKNGVFEKEKTFEDEIDGMRSTIKIEILNQSDLGEKGFNKSPQKFLPDYISVNEKKLEKIDMTNQKEILELRNLFRRFKQDNFSQYRDWRKMCALWKLFESYPSPNFLGHSPESIRTVYKKEEADKILGNMKSLFVDISLRMELEKNKSYALTNYFTWMYETKNWKEKKSPDEHPIEKMKKCSSVMIFHQDEFLIEKTLDIISTIFEKAVKWDEKTQDIQELKNTMSLLCFLLTHNIRNVRGTAAENEWIELAIYLSHKIKYSHDKDKLVDLEAFANPFFSQFKQKYNEMVHISK